MESASNASSDPECVALTQDQVRVLRINRPERSNSLSLSLQRTLVDEVLAARRNPQIRVLVLTGTGDRVFCAGADLKEIAEMDRAGRPYEPPINQSDRSLSEVITETFIPTIAALNGSAVAGGFELALSCDIRIAAPGTLMGLPESKVGMGANFGSVVLPRRVPLGIALEMLYTGEYITSEEALRWGLINHVVPREQLMNDVMALATRIARNAPLSIRRMKETAIKGLELPLWSALRLDVGPNPYSSLDRKEGIEAYLAKRKPQWRGR